MRPPVLRLKRGRERARVHPWIFKGEVADVSDVTPGDAVTVVDAAGHFVGRGLFNPRPTLCCRLLTRVDEPIDAAFLGRRLEAALAFREELARAGDGAAAPPGGEAQAVAPGLPARATRLVWSEADRLPGLVVDRYGEVLVFQCHTLGMALRRGDIVGSLRGRLGSLAVFCADEATAAEAEGFPAQRGWLDRAGPSGVIVTEGAVRLSVTFGIGHKTGLYLDQAANRRLAATLAGGRDVLDAFAYTAGFATHALVGGARRALCVESSPDALAGAHENLALNGVTGRAELRSGNAFDELRRLERAAERFGLVILDPPPFARSRAALEAAARGYKEVNLRAMRLLGPGGHLMTFTCSHHVSEAAFQEICREAAADAGVTLRVIQVLRQAPDHPILLTVPETRYLTGLLLQAV